MVAAVAAVDPQMAAKPEQAVQIFIYGQKGTAIYTNQPWPRVKFKGLKAKKDRPPKWGVHALQRSLEGFRAWVMDGEDFLIPAEESLPVLAAVEAIYRSAETKKQEKINAP